MQLLIPEFASWVALVLREVDPALKVLALRHNLNIEDGCIACLGKLFHLIYGNSVWSLYIGVIQ